MEDLKMIGTERQIAWAEDILKANREIAASEFAKYDPSKSKSETFKAARVKAQALVQDVTIEMESRISACDDSASKIINSRDKLDFYRLMRFAEVGELHTC